MNCFYCFQNEEFFDKENNIYCNDCRKYSKMRTKQYFYSLPRILIIILNRGDNNNNFKEHIDIPENLDFTQEYIFLDKNSYKKYKLISVISLLGEGISDGRSLAYVRIGNGDSFYCYDDENITEVQIDKVLIQKISKEKEEIITPYILFCHYYK